MAARRPPAAGLPPEEAILPKARRENFVVASLLLPADLRRHLLAVYAFARLVDDTGDESAGDRGALLDSVQPELEVVYEGGVPAHPAIRDLTRTIQQFDIPPDPFQRLIEANRRDQVVTRYETYEDLLQYCDLSANPVGHLVLRIFGVLTPDRVILSDAVCTGLQLTEHWQDVAEDAARGRVYLPQEDLRRFGCAEADLSAPRATPSLRALIAFEVVRARSLLRRGTPLVREMPGRARVAVGGFVAGGHAALDAIERADHEVLAARPRPSRARRLTRLIEVLGRTIVARSP